MILVRICIYLKVGYFLWCFYMVYMCGTGTICPGSSDPFYIVSYYINWVILPGHTVCSCGLCSPTFQTFLEGLLILVEG